MAADKNDHRITRCRSCGAQLIYLLTKAQKQMPVDAGTVEPEDREFDHVRHTSHFATCPNASQHRRT